MWRVGRNIGFTVEAAASCHQVRNMVGTLKLVGDGMWPARVAEALAARTGRRPTRRLRGCPCSPACRGSVRANAVPVGG
jgi:tRNA U38,U39,U40 pseudouridine synthase TruA